MVIHYCEKTLCELCHQRFPDRIEDEKGKSISVIDFKLPKNNYMVLEFIPNDKLDVKYYFVINFEKRDSKEIIVGGEGDIKLGNNRNFQNENFNVRYF